MAKPSRQKNAPITPIGEKLTWVEKPESIRKMIYGLAALCLLLFLADLAHIRHGKFAIEDILGFYGIYGFAAFAFIIIATKYLKMLIARKEDYYAPASVDAEDYPATELDVKDHGDD